MPRSHARLSIVMLLALGLTLAACGDTTTQVLTLPTGSATTAASTTSSTPTSPATTAAATTQAATSAAATPVSNRTATPAQSRPNPTGAAQPTSVAQPTTVDATPTPRPAIKPLTGFMGKLSLVKSDNAVYVSRFDGKEPQLVLGKPGQRVSDTQDGPLYAWPTWSRDGNKLAIIAMNFKGGQVTSSDVYVVGQDGKNPFKLQDTSPDRPIFMSWSPDGNLFSLLVSSGGQGLELRLFDTSKGPAAAGTLRKVAQGQSIYTGWSPDSQQLLIHSSTTSAEILALLAAKDAKAQAVPFKVNPSSFRTPAFSADGSRLAYAVPNDKSGYEDIYIEDKAGASAGHIETAGKGASFSWSPNGQRIAHSYLLPDGRGMLSKGIAISEVGAKPPADGKLTETQVVNEPIISFFWSPDGKKLAFNGFNDAQSLLTWKIYDFDTKKTTQLLEWYPSQDTVQMLEYYDQYSQTNSIWSPDSKAIVFAGFTKDEVDAITKSGSGSNADPLIYVMPVDGPQAGKPVQVAEGSLAFWSK